MKNFEKFEKEIIELTNPKVIFGVLETGGIPCKCNNMECCNCLLGELANRLNLSCNNARILWLYQEYKEHIKLSRLEFELLKHFKNQGVYYFVKDKDDTCVAFYMNKPNRSSEMWIPSTGNWYTMFAFKNCFQFVKWEDKEHYKIQDILDNCEVVEDENNK